MTDTKAECPSEEERILSLEGRSVDWYLQSLVSTVNASTIEFGVTLLVEGAIVSGLLVSGKKYFEIFSKEFADAYPGDDESKETVRTAFAAYADIYSQDGSNEEQPPPPQYIHLVNARCFSPGGQSLPGNRGVLWRGKINAVSGFSLGSLSAE